MKKIFLMAYARKNLGDDLFIKMILDRYPYNEYYMQIHDSSFLSDFCKEYKNFHVIEGPDTDTEMYKMDEHSYDGYIYVGGSIFMEGGKVYNLSPEFYDFIDRCNKSNIPFCYVSCNYGPYQTQEYFNLSKKTFETCKDICFRDKYSYDLFKESSKVRYAPDFAFTYPLNSTNRINDSVGISVIDFSIRNSLKDKEQDYLQMIVENIKQYIEQGKKVFLFSFCKYEGDENAIEKIMSMIENSENVNVVKFDGDIDKFLEIYSQMEYMICARFHAMILATIAKQKVYVLSYSKKIDNVISDLELNFPTIDLSEISKSSKLELDQFRGVEDSLVHEIVEKAKNQEKGIGDWLK